MLRESVDYLRPILHLVPASLLWILSSGCLIAVPGRGGSIPHGPYPDGHDEPQYPLIPWDEPRLGVLFSGKDNIDGGIVTVWRQSGIIVGGRGSQAPSCYSLPIYACGDGLAVVLGRNAIDQANWIRAKDVNEHQELGVAFSYVLFLSSADPANVRWSVYETERMPCQRPEGVREFDLSSESQTAGPTGVVEACLTMTSRGSYVLVVRNSGVEYHFDLWTLPAGSTP